MNIFDSELKKKSLMLFLGVSYGVTDLVFNKEDYSVSGVTNGKSVKMDVQFIETINQKDFVFDKNTFSKDGVLILDTYRNTYVLNRSSIKEFLRQVKRSINKEGELWFIPLESMPYKGFYNLKYEET